MKFNLPLIPILIFSFQCLTSLGQEDNSPKLQLVKVASLNTIDANKEFQKNVQLVQQQRALAVQLLGKMEETQDKDVHDKLKEQFDALQVKLNENNKLMFKTYGFSLNRNYVMTVEKSHVHMWVTEEEAVSINNKSQNEKGEASDSDSEKSGLRSLFNENK